MWKTWNKLFGWEYILFKYGNKYFIRRVRTLPSTTSDPYIMMYGEIWLISDGDWMGGEKREYTYIT